MRVVLVGHGAVGIRVARLLSSGSDLEWLRVVGRDPTRAAAALEGLDGRVSLHVGRPRSITRGTDVVVLCRPWGAVRLAEEALESGAHVVAAIDDPSRVRGLLALHAVARRVGRSLVVATTMAPGLSCVLARFAAAQLDAVSEVHVASFGTGGPACARRHHAALSSTALDLYDGAWRRRSGRSGRELVYFPEPVGGADCYRAALVDPELLAPAFPGASRISARMAATRRDRLTARLPMMRPPHVEGALGAVRVEVRGRLGGASESVVMGAQGRPAIIAGVVSAITARWAVQGRLARTGSTGLAEMVDAPGAFLGEVSAVGVGVARFEGSGFDRVGRPAPERLVEADASALERSRLAH